MLTATIKGRTTCAISVGIITTSFRSCLARVECRAAHVPAKPPERCPDRVQRASLSQDRRSQHESHRLRLSHGNPRLKPPRNRRPRGEWTNVPPRLGFFLLAP